VLKKIKFSHEYPKFKDLAIDKPVTLVWVLLIHKDDLSDYFIDYDTKYFVKGKKHNYPLQAKEYMMLFFMDYNGKLFTTLRRVTGWKEKYYLDSVGDQFKVVVTSMVKKK